MCGRPLWCDVHVWAGWGTAPGPLLVRGACHAFAPHPLLLLLLLLLLLCAVTYTKSGTTTSVSANTTVTIYGSGTTATKVQFCEWARAMASGQPVHPARHQACGHSLTLTPRPVRVVACCSERMVCWHPRRLGAHLEQQDLSRRRLPQRTFCEQQCLDCLHLLPAGCHDLLVRRDPHPARRWPAG